MEKFSATETMKFLTAYYNNACLWDPTNKMYKTKHARIAALQNISNCMNIKGFHESEVKQKIHSLRNTYTNELKKISDSKKSGATGDDIYQPKLQWFNTAHSFLGNVIRLSNGEKKSLTSNVSEVFVMASEIPERNFTNSRKRKSSEDDVLLNEPPSSSISIRNTTKDIQQMDEWDIFGVSIAMQLRGLPREEAYQGQIKIQSILGDIKINSLKKIKNRNNLPVSPVYSSLPSSPNLNTEDRDDDDFHRNLRFIKSDE